jgi:Tfp pilus assembly protein PilO
MPDWIWINNVVFPILGMGMATFFGWTILKMINRHLERRAEERRLNLTGAGPSEEMQVQIDALRDQVESLAERLDFNERLLAQQNDRARLPRG